MNPVVETLDLSITMNTKRDRDEGLNQHFTLNQAIVVNS